VGCRTHSGVFSVRFQFIVSLFVLLLLAGKASAVTTGLNPYTGIVERNSFGLRPPVNPADLVKPPPPVFADIKLQGITTILGRKQVLMKIRVPAKPPEPAFDQSLVLIEGQREGEVEVLEINPAEGTVKVNNGGTILPLNMKDHGEKPTPGAAIPATSTAIPRLPGVPAPAPPAASVLPAPSVNSGGGVDMLGATTAQTVSGFGSTGGGTAATANSAQKTIPTRTLRTSPTAGAGRATASPANEFQNISPEAQAILIEAQRTQIQPGGFDPLPKTAITPRQP